MGAEHDAQARVHRTAIAGGKLFAHRGQAVLQAVGEGAGEAGHVEELANLAHVHAALQAELLQRDTVVLAVLAAARVTRVGAGGQHQHVAVAVLVGLGEHVLHVGLPVAVRPGNRDARAALGQRLLQRGEQSAVLLVNRRDTAVGAVVGGDLLEALVRDAAAGGHIAQERDDVLLTLGAAEGGENHQVVGSGFLGANTDDGPLAAVLPQGLLGQPRRAVGGRVGGVGTVGDDVIGQEGAVQGALARGVCVCGGETRGTRRHPGHAGGGGRNRGVLGGGLYRAGRTGVGATASAGSAVRLLAHARTSAISSAPMRRPV